MKVEKGQKALTWGGIDFKCFIEADRSLYLVGTWNCICQPSDIVQFLTASLTIRTQGLPPANLAHKVCLLVLGICGEPFFSRLLYRGLDRLFLLCALRFCFLLGRSSFLSRLSLQRFSELRVCPSLVIKVECVCCVAFSQSFAGDVMYERRCLQLINPTDKSHNIPIIPVVIVPTAANAIVDALIEDEEGVDITDVLCQVSIQKQGKIATC